MTTVTLPLWLVILALGALVVLVIERLLFPSVRWVLRRRLHTSFNELNARLQLPVQPFAFTQRRVLVDRLTYDPQVMDAVSQAAEAEDVPREVMAEKAARYAREIVPSFSPTAYYGLGIRASRWIAQTLYRVRLGSLDAAHLSEIDNKATVVFVMNHRSNLDYMLVTYLAADRTTLSYAAGEWARVWPLQQIAKLMGAFFIRRRSRNALYRRVLARYVQMATEGGVTQAVFPEGGLSRDGSLGPAKLGLVSYIVEGFDPARGRDVVFIPVAINYDRVLEDRVLTGAELEADGKPRFRASASATLGFFLNLIWLRLRGKFHRFGYASVSFGAPVSLREFLDQSPADTIAELGETLMAEIGRIVPVLPVSLVATVMQSQEGPITDAKLRAEAFALKEALVRAGAHFHLPRDDFDYAVTVGLRMLKERGILRKAGETWHSVEVETHLLTYYTNAIAHLPRG
ncbi:MAG: 1-acyl-sn-glycerol-3-phosphate acyltransferase [Pseudomonadota bacterium]